MCKGEKKRKGECRASQARYIPTGKLKNGKRRLGVRKRKGEERRKVKN